MKKLSWIFLCLVLVSCKGGGGGGASSEALEDSTHYGVYQACKNFPGENVSRRTIIYTNETLLSEVNTYYSNYDCQEGNQNWDLRYIYSYTRTGNNYRLYVEGMTITSLSSVDLNYNNSNTFCGYNNWVLSVPKNVLGKNCDGDIVNQGDYMDVTAVKSGSTLAVTIDSQTTNFTMTGAWDFSTHGQTVANGNYAFFNGTIAAYLVIANNTYAIAYFDPATKRYFIEDGTFSSANNVATLTVGSYSPDCGTDEGSQVIRKFAQTSFSLAIEGMDETKSVLFEKVPFNVVQFRDAFLGTGYTAGCF